MEDINNYIVDSINKVLSLLFFMNETMQVPLTTGAAKNTGKGGSRVGRLLALLSVLITVDRRPRHGLVAPLPPHRRYLANRRYPLAEGPDVGRLLQ